MRHRLKFFVHFSTLSEQILNIPGIAQKKLKIEVHNKIYFSKVKNNCYIRRFLFKKALVMPSNVYGLIW